MSIPMRPVNQTIPTDASTRVLIELITILCWLSLQLIIFYSLFSFCISPQLLLWNCVQS